MQDAAIVCIISSDYSHVVYPPGSVGAAFKAYLLTEEWKKKAQATREKVWWPAWFRIRDMWGDCDPNTTTFGLMSTWRTDLEREHGLSVAHKTLKIWRALWVVMQAMRIAHGTDPSTGVRNEAPPPRYQTWEEREALHLAKSAWRLCHRCHLGHAVSAVRCTYPQGKAPEGANRSG